LNAYKKAVEEGFSASDDAGIVENFGCRVTVVEGDGQNRKITTQEDIFWAKARLEVS
jgi:2-C-methyl-D-erythritol 4-phosphate cytidylyltransferase